MSELVTNENHNVITYGLNDKPKLGIALVISLQHFFAIFASIVSIPLVVCNALNLNLDTSSYIVAMSLVFSGIGAFIQAKKIGWVGSGLLSIQGTGAIFIPILILIGKRGGLPAIFGAAMAGSLVYFVMSYFLYLSRGRIFTPLINGITLILIGITLLKLAILSCAGGNIAQLNGTFGSFQHLGLAGLTLLLIIIFSSCKNHFLRIGSIFFSMVIGYIVSIFLGSINFHELHFTNIIQIPTPLKFGLSFHASDIVLTSLIFMMCTIESASDIAATAKLSGEPLTGKSFCWRISSGLLGDGVSTLLGSIFGAFPLQIFAQNNGVIQMTGVASRCIGYYVALFLVLCGIFPFLNTLITLMPMPVLGAVMLVVFGSIASYGIKIIAHEALDRRDLLIMAISFGICFGIDFSPNILNQLPPMLYELFHSGIIAGGFAAIILNLVLKKPVQE